jgi:hypothetical protein
MSKTLIDHHGKETIGKVSESMMAFHINLRLAPHAEKWTQGHTIPCICCPNFPGKHVYGMELNGALDYVYNELMHRLKDEGREKGRFQITIRSADIPHDPEMEEDE